MSESSNTTDDSKETKVIEGNAKPKDLPPKATVESKDDDRLDASSMNHATESKPPAVETEDDAPESVDYGVKVIEALTIDYKPTIVICSVSEDVKPGLYYIENINDVMIKQKIWAASGFIEYRGDGRIELVVMNLVDEYFRIQTDFTIAKLLRAK